MAKRCIRTPAERKRIALRYYELREKHGLDTKAIAERLGVTYSALKVILNWYKNRC